MYFKRFKVVFLGEFGVGKLSFVFVLVYVKVFMYLDGKFYSIVGVDFYIWRLVLDGVEFYIVDCVG